MKAVLPVFFIVSFLSGIIPIQAAGLSQPEALEETGIRPDAFNEFSKRLSEITPGDAEAYFNLALFCLDNDLPDQAEFLLGEAAKNPAFKKRAIRLLEGLAGEPDKSLYESASKYHASGYLAEAKRDLEALRAAYPKSRYIYKMKSLLRKIDREALNKPYLLAPVTDSPAELEKIIARRAEDQGSRVEDAKKGYFTDILKKAEYFADVLAVESDSGEKKEEYLSYAIRCAEEVSRLSDDVELKGKADDLRSRVIKQLFTEHPVSQDLKNIDYYYEKLYLVKDSGFIEDICGKYIKEGEAYLKKARQASGDAKINNLVSAYKCFSFANAYTKSAEVKEASFKKMKLINKEKRREINKKKTEN